MNEDRKSTGTTQIIIAGICLVLGAVVGVIVMTTFVPHKETPVIKTPTAPAANPTPMSVTVTQYTAPRFQLVPSTIQGMFYTTLETGVRWPWGQTEQTVFKIDTQTGKSWRYYRQGTGDNEYWMVVTNFEDFIFKKPN